MLSQGLSETSKIFFIIFSRNFIICTTVCTFVVICSCFDLECQFSEIPYGWGPFMNPSGDLKCTVQNFVVRAKDQVITSVNLQSSEMHRNQSITKLYINSQIVHFIPGGFENFFPSIDEVQVINSSLKVIDKFDLKAFANLEFLNLPHNYLEVLHNDLFVFTPKLRYVYLNNNNLKIIGENVFDALKSTYFLASLESNNCINFFFHNREGQNNFPEFKNEVKSKCK